MTDPAPPGLSRASQPRAPQPRAPEGHRSGRRMLLLDAGGALLSFTALLLVVRPIPAFGSPDAVTIPLAAVAAALTLFSAGLAVLPTAVHRHGLTVVIGANTLYAAVTVILLLAHRHALTAYDLAYFSAELLVLAALVRAELRTRRRLS